ncbi:ribokinase [Plastorhodobacter daqingensis]|uniref:Ribokinase n=1 Tax=Plastorhodobacter daqingensis TaxID=1387281 RepID=A0ABW2UGF2_9RHOB
MAIWNLGSINIDHFYHLPHLPGPGETLAALGYATGLGGKGANQSVAAARAGARVHHIGAVGARDKAVLDQLAADGIDTTHVARVEGSTGHAIINIDPAGENNIVIHGGANLALDPAAVARALSAARAGDILLIQNETCCQAEAARIGRERGLRVVYSAAPFDVDAVRAVLAFIDILCVNAVEEAQLRAALGGVSGPELVVTLGAEGAEWRGRARVPAYPVTPVDTTGAGDCFTGNMVAALDAGLAPEAAMRRAAAAAAIQVTRPGTADAMPTAAETDAFLQEHS